MLFIFAEQRRVKVEFASERNGYKKQEVDTYIESLQKELLQWKNRCIKAEGDYFAIKEKQEEIRVNGENIAIALTAAIEKAKQIEASSKNVYKLKIQQISILYDRWEMLLNEMTNKYPDLEDSHNIKTMLNDFKKSIENVLRQDIQNDNSAISSDNDTMRVLLAKMSNYSVETKDPKVKKMERKPVSKDLKNGQTELNRIEEKSMIKPISSLELGKNEKFETLADKFLTQEDDSSSKYTNFLSKNNNDYPSPNESGFDLKEAVNPKENLDEIMKSFDFFKHD